jgi:hypothetical protein
MEIPKTLWLKNHMKEEDFERSFFFEQVDLYLSPCRLSKLIFILKRD